MCAVVVDVNTLPVTLMSLSVKMTAMGVTCDIWFDERYRWLLLLILQTSLQVSVTQVKITVSPGHTLSADDVRLTEGGQ